MEWITKMENLFKPSFLRTASLALALALTSFPTMAKTVGDNWNFNGREFVMFHAQTQLEERLELSNQTILQTGLGCGAIEAYAVYDTKNQWILMCNDDTAFLVRWERKSNEIPLVLYPLRGGPAATLGGIMREVYGKRPNGNVRKIDEQMIIFGVN